ncbi:hypothetical protein LCGC14_2130750 [marine sediment metagenome]|uniref:DUF3987 domain-containing protein n=1 Tax=marine sediment metagenome TaxID=412755 RepID=A0A0F9GXN9_9ZZZZ
MDLIEDFVRGTANLASPEQFRRWSAISMVSAALSRRVWTCFEDDKKLFANTYVILVSSPGLGKTRPMDLVAELLRPMSWIKRSANEVTRQRTIQDIADVFPEGKAEGERSFFFLVREMATFMPEGDAAWMQAIADLWDCPREYEKAIKGKSESSGRSEDIVYKPYVSLLFGAQPAWFAEGLPKTSYEMGFPARVFFIYADMKPERKLFLRRKQLANKGELHEGLKQLRTRKGEIMWSKPAQAAFIAWMDGGCTPVIDDPLLNSYNVRRDVHAAKIALINACARGHEEIELDDLERAWRYMFAAEVQMPAALTNAGGNVYRAQEELAVEYVQREWDRTGGRHVHEREVRRRLSKTTSTMVVERILNELIAQGRLKMLYAEKNKAPNRLLKPGVG